MRGKKSRSTTRRAKLFWNGRSQAVRLPKDFRFSGEEVEIRKEGESVILEPVKRERWPDGYWQWVEEHADELELGEIEPLGGELLDVALEQE